MGKTTKPLKSAQIPSYCYRRRRLVVAGKQVLKDGKNGEGRQNRKGCEEGGSFEKENLTGLPSPCWPLASQLDRQKRESLEVEILFCLVSVGRKVLLVGVSGRFGVR